MDGLFYGWYDPDKRKTPATKLTDALSRYRERFGAEPAECLAHPDDAAAIGPDLAGVAVRPAGFLPLSTFYVRRHQAGEAAAPAPDPVPASDAAPLDDVARVRALDAALIAVEARLAGKLTRAERTDLGKQKRRIVTETAALVNRIWRQHDREVGR